MYSSLHVSTLIPCVVSAKSGRRPKPWCWVWVGFVVSSLFFFFFASSMFDSPCSCALSASAACLQLLFLTGSFVWISYCRGLECSLWRTALPRTLQALLVPSVSWMCASQSVHPCPVPNPKAWASPAAGPASVTADTRSSGCSALTLKGLLDMFGPLLLGRNSIGYFKKTHLH